MIGHYYGYVTEPTPMPILLHKMVTFSVSIFYILSGITLYSVYGQTFRFNFQSLYSFAVKRAFRILPLLWVAISATIYLNHLYHLPWRLYLFNYSGLFGLIPERNGIAYVSWSIGNEVVFYLLFPVFLLVAKQGGKLLFALLFLATVAVAGFFTFQIGTVHSFYNSPAPIAKEAWHIYIHPLNQLFLFVGGVLIGYMFSGKRIPYARLGMVVSGVAFLTFPIYERIDMFAGIERFILCGLCFVICTMLLTGKRCTAGRFHRPLQFIGDTSYSIYLLHPIVYMTITRLANKFFPITGAVLFLGCVLGTLVAAYVVYTIIEKPAMNLGRTVSLRGRQLLTRNNEIPES